MLLKYDEIALNVNYTLCQSDFTPWAEFVNSVALFAYQIVSESFPHLLELEDHTIFKTLEKHKLGVKIPDIPVSFEDYVEFFQKRENQTTYFIAYSATKFVVRFLSNHNLNAEDILPPHLHVSRLM